MRRAKLLAAASVAALTLSGCGFTGLYSANLPGGPNLGSHPLEFTVEFTDVLDLVPQSNVKVNDVAVGKVVSVSLDGWIAKVKVRVNKDVNLPENARAAVQMTSLLGEKFIALEQPLSQPSATRLHSGQNILATSTSTAPEVEEVLGALSLLLNGGGLQQIQTITTELNKALHGNETAVRDLIPQLNAFVGTLDHQKTQITTALDNIDTLAATLNRQKQILINALGTFPQALQILSGERTQLVTLLKSLANLGSVATNLLTTSVTPVLVNTPSGKAPECPAGRTSCSAEDLFVSSLNELQAPLEALTAAGDNLPKALNILLTFPFPIGTTNTFVKGDYANLAVHLDLNLSDNLCGLNIPALCTLVNSLSPAPAKATTKSATTKSATTTPLLLPGLGG
ncbi:MAG: MCE family protein [Actinomycetota bacterium]|nr:MCE family protein [Actinomycetota bacterium]